jgi:hypothetical protein
MNGISAPVIKAHGSLLASQVCQAYFKKGLSLKNGTSPDTAYAEALLLDFPASKTVRNTCLFFRGYPVYSNFVMAAQKRLGHPVQ